MLYIYPYRNGGGHGLLIEPGFRYLQIIVCGAVKTGTDQALSIPVRTVRCDSVRFDLMWFGLVPYVTAVWWQRSAVEAKIMFGRM